MNILFISEASRSKPRLKPNEILKELFVKVVIYSRARPTITSVIVNSAFHFAFHGISILPKSCQLLQEGNLLPLGFEPADSSVLVQHSTSVVQQ